MLNKICHILLAWIDRFYLILKLANEQFEIQERLKEKGYQDWQIVKMNIEKLKARGGNKDVIRSLLSITPDEYAKIHYVKDLYESEVKL